MADYYLADSCLWLDYLTGKGKKEFLDQEIPLALSALSLFEIAKKLKEFNFPFKKIQYILRYLQEYNLILNVDSAISIHAINFSEKLGAIDALLYATASANELHFFTRDNDFRGLPNTHFI